MHRFQMLALIAATFCACSTPPEKDANAAANNDSSCVGDAPGCGVCEAPLCQDGSWQCQGTPCAQPGCPDDEPVCTAGKQAECSGRIWSCVDSPFQEAPAGCGYDAMSDLSGVSITFPGDRCSWTLAEVAQGIEIPFAVNVDEAHEITPRSQQNGCDEPGPSGLQVFGQIFGNDHTYCLCDVGLCDNTTQTLTLNTGVTHSAYSWEGLNWFGPSDTGNVPGAAFPAGMYTFQVRAVGETANAPYEVYGRLTIELTR